MQNQNIVIYTDEQGQAALDVNLENETVWLSQKQMSALFDKNVKTINEHIGNIFKDGELGQNSVIRNFRITAADGKSYDVAHYSLDVIISVGYRIKSKRGAQFRIWANKIPKNYLIKGYALNQKRLDDKSLHELTATIELVRKSIEAKELGSEGAKGRRGFLTLSADMRRLGRFCKRMTLTLWVSEMVRLDKNSPLIMTRQKEL